MARNDGEHPLASNFGVPLPAGTGAPGSAGAEVTASRGDLMTVQATPPDGRWYAAVSAPVDVSDTSGATSDAPNQLWATGTDQVSASWSAGSGHVGGPPHPDAMEIPAADGRWH